MWLCVYVFCNVWEYVFLGFVMCAFCKVCLLYLWVLYCVIVCMCECVYVWICNVLKMCMGGCLYVRVFSYYVVVCMCAICVV